MSGTQELADRLQGIHCDVYGVYEGIDDWILILDKPHKSDTIVTLAGFREYWFTFTEIGQESYKRTVEAERLHHMKSTLVHHSGSILLHILQVLLREC